jgi:diaminopimelate decarboxylase
MKYIKKKLTIEKVNIKALAKKFGTPAYCYSYQQLKENINNFKKSFSSFSPLICFAIKSNTNVNLIKEIGKFGLGADVVSMGELMRALKAGINPNKIVFSGVGKTTEEINFAINKKILLINAESKSEILEIERLAKKNKKNVNVGIRLNPNVDAKTISQISS